MEYYNCLSHIKATLDVFQVFFLLFTKSLRERSVPYPWQSTYNRLFNKWNTKQFSQELRL